MSESIIILKTTKGEQEVNAKISKENDHGQMIVAMFLTELAIKIFQSGELDQLFLMDEISKIFDKTKDDLEKAKNTTH